MIDLKPFCGVETRYYLEQPWSSGAYTYASDGAIIVRVARRDDVPETDATGLVNAEYVFRPGALGTTFTPLPPFDLPDDDDCHACGGSGYAHACDDCGHECGECGGGGSTASQTSVGIFGASYGARYIALLRELPDISIETGVKPGNEPLHFRFDGGDGMLMPLSNPWPRHVEVECAQ